MQTVRYSSVVHHCMALCYGNVTACSPRSTDRHCNCSESSFFHGLWKFLYPPGLFSSWYVISQLAAATLSLYPCKQTNFFSWLQSEDLSRNPPGCRPTFPEQAKVLHDIIVSSFNLPTIVPIHWMPSSSQRIVNGKTPAFGQPLIFQLWSTSYSFWSHWLVQ